MPESGEQRARRSANEVQVRPAGYAEYAAARERYFERLRVDSEMRRLEGAWRMPPPDAPASAGP